MGAFQREQAPSSLCVETDTLLWICVSFRRSSIPVYSRPANGPISEMVNLNHWLCPGCCIFTSDARSCASLMLVSRITWWSQLSCFEKDPILLSDVFSLLCCITVCDCQWTASVVAILLGVGRQMVGLHWAAGGPGHLLLDRSPQKVVINGDQVADDAPSQTMAEFYMTVALQRKVCRTSSSSGPSREFSAARSFSFLCCSLIQYHCFQA